MLKLAEEQLAFEKKTKFHERSSPKRKDKLFELRIKLYEQCLKLYKEKFALDTKEYQETCSERVELKELMSAMAGKQQKVYFSVLR